jgi:hypothetical protein
LYIHCHGVVVENEISKVNVLWLEEKLDEKCEILQKVKWTNTYMNYNIMHVMLDFEWMKWKCMHA